MLAMCALILAGCWTSSPSEVKPSRPAPSPKPPPVAPAEPASVETLRVTALEPARGDAAGGTYVRIIGEGFLASGPRMMKAYFGRSQGTVVRFSSDSEIIVQAPGGTSGDVVDVLLVFEPGGQISLSGAFTFVASGP
jgi:IPT/TIG domain